ncbi:Uncharacterized protein SCF082_LOCUS41445 [Durusdinium trenchii]|uniref:Uncharacterized protein n=1 Tax=Durusdinium trenchii TaxID=1381693 RepID=A0ABP0QKM3_9DINO
MAGSERAARKTPSPSSSSSSGISSALAAIPKSRFWPKAKPKEPKEKEEKESEEEFGHNLDPYQALGFLEHEQVFAKAKAQPEAIHAEPGYQPEAGYRLAGQIAAKARSAFRMEKARRDKPPVGSQTKPRWRAVWCHERCHKADAATLRAQLQVSISRFQGELVSQKTASKFKLWLEDDSSAGVVPEEKGEGGGFYVLLSDWRQLKPCLEILEEEGAAQPAAVILLCANVAKAQIWNKSRPPASFPLHMLQLDEEEAWVSQLEKIIGRLIAPSAPSDSAPVATSTSPAWDRSGDVCRGAQPLWYPATTRFSL